MKKKKKNCTEGVQMWDKIWKNRTLPFCCFFLHAWWFTFKSMRVISTLNRGQMTFVPLLADSSLFLLLFPIFLFAHFISMLSWIEAWLEYSKIYHICFTHCSTQSIHLKNWSFSCGILNPALNLIWLHLLCFLSKIQDINWAIATFH